MIIDFHTHVFPDELAPTVIPKLAADAQIAHYTDGTAAGLLASMERSGVDVSVVLPVATNVKQVDRLNEVSARNNENFNGRGIWYFGAIHPDSPNWKEQLTQVKDWGLKGVKIHPVYQKTDMDDPRYLRIIERCAELDLIVSAHTGRDVGIVGEQCTPEKCRRAIEAVPWNKLILAHMGGWRQWDQVWEELAGLDVYFDTGFCLGRIQCDPGQTRPEDDRWLLGWELYHAILEKHGVERILFATDSPWGDQADGLAQLRALGLNRQDLEAIQGGNGQKLLGL